MNNRYYPAKEILPGLWIGSEADAKNPNFTEDAFVVNCTTDVPLPKNAAGRYHIKIWDHPSQHEELLKNLPIVVRAIDEYLARGKKVLVHCRAGMQRSAATVAAYIMYKRGYTWDEAKKFIQAKKPETFTPVPTFDKTMKVYYALLQKGLG